MISPDPTPAEQGLISLIYASSTIRKMPTDELLAILQKAREKNQRLNITGMLLYKDGNFLQALEGPEQAVLDLYKVIQQDTRHYEVTTIFKRPIKQRDFTDWEMGFVDLDNPEVQNVPGYSDFLKEPLTIRRFSANPSIARTFLLTFKESIR